MIVEVPLPDNPDLTGVDLVPANDRGSLPSRLTSLVAVSEPVVDSLAIDGVAAENPHLGGYLQKLRRTHEVKSLRLACSFTSRSHPVIRAAVAVSLTTGDTAGDETQVIAWCLHPTRIDKPVQTLPAKLSFDIAVPPKAKVELGPSQESASRERYIVLAHGEGTATPEWVFRRTSQNDFDGIHWLGMMVLVPRKTPAAAQIALTAAIRHNVLGIIRCTAELPTHIRTVKLS